MEKTLRPLGDGGYGDEDSNEMGRFDGNSDEQEKSSTRMSLGGAKMAENGGGRYTRLWYASWSYSEGDTAGLGETEEQVVSFKDRRCRNKNQHASDPGLYAPTVARDRERDREGEGGEEGE